MTTPPPAGHEPFEADPGGFEALMHTLPGMAYRCRNDADWTMAWVSEGARELTGYAAEDIVGNRTCAFASLIHPDDAGMVAAEVARAATAGEMFRINYRLRHRDGGLRWVWEQGRVLDGADAGAGDIVGHIVDVTPLVEARRERDEMAERERRAREEAAAAREQFRLLFESAPGAFLVLAVPDLRIAAVSNAYLEMTATHRDSLVGKGLFEAFPDDPADPTADGAGNLRASLERVVAFRAQDAMPIQRYPIPDAAGGFEERFGSVVNAPVLDEDGQVRFIIHRVEDVTEFVRARRAGRGGPVRGVLDSLESGEAELYRQSRTLAKLNESLRTSEAMFRRIFDEAPVGIAVVHPDGRLALANASYRAMLGLGPGPLRRQRLSQWLDPGHRDAVLARDARVAAGEQPGYEDEECYLDKGGKQTWVQVRVSLLRNDGGDGGHSLLRVAQDITARKRAEGERDRVAGNLRANMDSMSDAFFLLDHGWQFVFVNRRAESLLHRTAAELAGRTLWEEFPEAAIAPEFQACRDAMADGLARSFEVWFAPWRNWFEINVYPTPQGLAVYFRPVTERKQMTAQLVASEERFRYVAEATADAVWDWDLQSDAVWWNRGMQVLFGYAAEEVEPDSRSWTTRLHPDDLSRVVRGIHAVIDGGGIQWQEEYRFRRKDGRYAHVADRGFVIRDGDGKPLRMVGGMTDMTERIALEAQLRQSQRLESVGQLTGGMAHDFNNLLTVILGNAEVLSEQLGHLPALRSLADMVAQAAQRGADLTSRLLAFARKQPLEPRAVDVNQMLTEMDGLLRRTLGEHVELELARGGGLWTAMADPVQVESAVLNLCINARDAMPGGGRLTVETGNVRLDHEYAAQHPDLEPGQYVMVAVSDTGTGIPPDVLPRVFEPFFTTKQAGKGTGLGLSMVYGFVKQSRGHVSIYSEPRQGTTVRLYLPRHVGGGASRPVVDDDAQGGTGTILLVEDDPLVRRYTETQLVALGYRVLVTANAADAMEVLAGTGQVDLLLTDVVMPGGMNGRQLAEEAARLRPGLPVLFASGYTENAIVHHGRLDPGVQLLAKPYRKAELARRVRQVMAAGGGDARR